LSKDTLLIGTYTEVLSPELQGRGQGILVSQFDPRNGSIKVKATLFSPNPSYLAAGKRRTVYAVCERSLAQGPSVHAFSVNRDLTLKNLDSGKLDGGYPCHLAYHQGLGCVLVACYETGHVSLHPVAADGGVLPAQEIILHSGKSVNGERQQSAHPHMILIDGNRIFVPDLGMDEVVCYTVTRVEGKLKLTEKIRIPVPKGSGPRHAVMHPRGTHLFVLNELTATISVIHCVENGFTLQRTLSILPTGLPHASGAAAIRIAPDGRYIYASDRGYNGIAVIRFDVTTGSMEQLAFYSTGGKNPRDIQLSKTGDWLLTANMDTDSISMFAVDKRSGLLSLQNQLQNIVSPSCLCWLQD
jgi:6-phosphogluconolactonase